MLYLMFLYACEPSLREEQLCPGQSINQLAIVWCIAELHIPNTYSLTNINYMTKVMLRVAFFHTSLSYLSCLTKPKISFRFPGSWYDITLVLPPPVYLCSSDVRYTIYIKIS